MFKNDPRHLPKWSRIFLSSTGWWLCFHPQSICHRILNLKRTTNWKLLDNLRWAEQTIKCSIRQITSNLTAHSPFIGRPFFKPSPLHPNQIEYIVEIISQNTADKWGYFPLWLNFSTGLVALKQLGTTTTKKTAVVVNPIETTFPRPENLVKATPINNSAILGRRPHRKDNHHHTAGCGSR